MRTMRVPSAFFATWPAIVRKLAVALAMGSATGFGISCMAESTPTVTGTVSYRERIALRPGSVVEIVLQDVSRQDVPAPVLARETIEPRHEVPIPFELRYDPGAIDERHRYAVRATIRHGDQPIFVTDRVYAVLTRGSPAHADLVLVRSGGGRAPVANAELVGTRWLLRTLDGADVEPGEHPPFLQFSREESGTTAFGSGGCNTFRGGCEISGASLSFGHLATTMMACPEPAMALESRFLRALAAVDGYEIRSTWLILRGPDGELGTLEAWYE
jgi:putative lipoprotein